MNRESFARLSVSLLAGPLLMAGCSSTSAPGPAAPSPTAPVSSATAATAATAVAPSQAQPQPAQGPTRGEPPPVSSPAVTVAASASPGSPASTTITIGTDKESDELFAPDKATVKAGAEVVVTFENESKLPHNLAFQKPMSGYTRLVVEPGESDTIRVVPPGPGTYQFVCTIHPLMVGDLTVEP